MKDTVMKADLTPLDRALRRASSAASESSRAALNNLSVAVKVSVLK
jgi:hypothetical protein